MREDRNTCYRQRWSQCEGCDGLRAVDTDEGRYEEEAGITRYLFLDNGRFRVTLITRKKQQIPMVTKVQDLPSIQPDIEHYRGLVSRWNIDG